jgi:CAAX protease family protein
MERPRHSMNLRTRPAVVPTIIGLIAALAGPFMVQFVLAPLILQSPLSTTSAVLLSQGMLWLLAVAVIAITRWWERKPWTWLGLRPISWRAVLLAGALGVVLSLAVPALIVVVNRLVPTSPGGTVVSVAASGPAWLLLVGVLTASVTEELLFRAYVIERLVRLTGTRWPGALLSLGAFVAFHLQGWNPGHVIGVVLPLGAVMTGLYLWRRSVLFVIITHFLLDLPIVLMAFAGLAIDVAGKA